MSPDELRRFASDLREIAGLDVALEVDLKPTGLHVLRIACVDFFFHADGTGYDGWGKCLTGLDARGKGRGAASEE